MSETPDNDTPALESLGNPEITEQLRPQTHMRRAGHIAATVASKIFSIVWIAYLIGLPLAACWAALRVIEIEHWEGSPMIVVTFACALFWYARRDRS